MTPAPPRRPRRWWTVLVQSAICVGLAAMVAWPERRTPVYELAAMLYPYDGDEKADLRASMLEANALGVIRALKDAPDIVARHPASRLVAVWQSHRYRVDEWRERMNDPDDGYFRQLGPNKPTRGLQVWRYRDAGLHVLLGDLSQ